jgi:hypothetical protein
MVRRVRKKEVEVMMKNRQWKRERSERVVVLPRERDASR